MNAGCDLTPELASEFGVTGSWRFAQVRLCEWSDMDALAHVSNSTYLEWYVEMRIGYFRRAVGAWPRPDNINFVVRSLAFTYNRPLVMGDRVLLTAKTESMRQSSFVQRYGVWSGGEVGSGEAVCVMVQSPAITKVAMAGSVRTAIQQFEMDAVVTG